MTLCVAFFLCLIDVRSYDLVQEKSIGCWRRYSIPFHGSEDSSLCVLHIFSLHTCHHGQSMVVCFWRLQLLLHKGWSLSFLTLVFSEYFLKLGTQWFYEPFPVDTWALRTPAGTRDQVQCSELQSGFPFSHTPSANSSSYTYFTWPFWSVPIKTWFGWCLYVSSCSWPTAPGRVVPHAEETRHCRCHGALCGHILARFLSLMPVLCRQNRLLVLQESEKGLFSWTTFRGEISLFLSVFT